MKEYSLILHLAIQSQQQVNADHYGFCTLKVLPSTVSVILLNETSVTDDVQLELGQLPAVKTVVLVKQPAARPFETGAVKVSPDEGITLLCAATDWSLFPGLKHSPYTVAVYANFI